MKVSTSRGRLLLGERGLDYYPAPSLTQPIDDLLGLKASELKDYGPYADHLLKYGRFWSVTDTREGRDRHAQLLARWRGWATTARPRLLRAARRAEEGHLPATLARELERVLYTPGNSPDEVPDGDLPALAAWCLVEALRRQPITVRECERCRRPWLAQPGQNYCQRPAPGHSRDCRTLAKEAAFLSSVEVRGYRREYKRLHELKRRGTISMAELNAWRQANSPANWQPYRQWLEAKPRKEK